MPLDPTRLRALRIETGLTARGLQTAAGVPTPTVYRIEAGQAVAVTVATVEALAAALSRHLGRPVSVAELLTPPPDPDPAVEWVMPRGRGRPRKEKNDG